MTDQPLYERLIADGLIAKRHELTIMRFAACKTAADKQGFLDPEDPSFLISQYAYMERYVYTCILDAMETLLRPIGLCASLVYEGSGGLVLGSLHGLAISEADALDELTQAF